MTVLMVGLMALAFQTPGWTWTLYDNEVQLVLANEVPDTPQLRATFECEPGTGITRLSLYDAPMGEGFATVAAGEADTPAHGPPASAGHGIARAAPAAVCDAPVTSLTVRLAATCATLMPGEALRLSIAGAAFPAYALNPGTGACPKTASTASALVTTLGVHHGAARPSRLILTLA